MTRSLSFFLTSSLLPLEKGFELKFMRCCLPLGKCYAAVITYILAGLYGKSRTGWPLAAFNHHYTLTLSAPRSLLVPLKSLPSPRIKVKICTRQPGWKTRSYSWESFHTHIGRENLKRFPLETLAEHSFHFRLIDWCTCDVFWCLLIARCLLHDHFYKKINLLS